MIMAKYIVEDVKTSKYEKNFKFPLINLIPAIVWSIPVYQKAESFIGKGLAYGVVAVFFVLYMAFSYMPVIALAPGIGGIIILTALFWAPADHIGNNVVRIIVKAVILIVVVMIEFCVVINATLPWLQRKTSTPPRVRRVEE